MSTLASFYVMAFEPLLRKLSDIPKEPVCGGSVSAYADDLTIIATEMEHLQRVGEAIKVYKTVAGEKN